MSPRARRSSSPPPWIPLITLLTVVSLPAISSPAAAEGQDLRRANLPQRGLRGFAPRVEPSTRLKAIAERQHEARRQRAVLDRSRRVDVAKLSLGLRNDEPVPISTNLVVETLSSSGKVELDTVNGKVKVETELTLRAKSEALNTLYLYLGNFKNDHTHSVSDSQGVLSSQNVGNGVITVVMRTPVAVGSSIVLTIAQGGTPECQSSFHQIVTCRIGAGQSFDIGTAWQPLPYDLNAQQLVYPQAATLSLRVPKTDTAIATGVADGLVDNLDGTHTFSFRNDIKGSFSFAVASSYKKGVVPFAGGHEVHSYLFSPLAQQLGSAWRTRSAEIMAFHGARYGEYGPKVINVAEIPDGTGAAFGPMMTIFMPSQTLAVDPSHWASSITLAHELAHQWFAGHIESEEAISPWLSEGFATFAEMEFTAAQATQEVGYDYGAEYRRGANLSYVYTVPPAQDLPISSMQIVQAQSTIYFTVTYTKGALLVDTLRYLLGDDATFFAAMKGYRKDHEKKGASVASLVASLEKASNKSLGKFAQNWAFRAGYPTYSVALTRSKDAQTGRYTATIDVKADRDFGMPLELSVVTADGKSEVVKLPYTGTPAYTLTLDRDSEILSVRFDPNAHLIGRQRPQLAGDIHINGAIDGIDVLYAAMMQGEQFQPQFGGLVSFASWADLYTDGRIDDKDLDIVLNAFGQKQSPQGGN